jgi:hypothetical protein
MKFRVEVNITRQPVTIWFDTAEKATHVCASLNVEAHHRGQGGTYGVYDSDGERVP